MDTIQRKKSTGCPSSRGGSKPEPGHAAGAPRRRPPINQTRGAGHSPRRGGRCPAFDQAVGSSMSSNTCCAHRQATAILAAHSSASSREPTSTIANPPICPLLSGKGAVRHRSVGRHDARHLVFQPAAEHPHVFVLGRLGPPRRQPWRRRGGPPPGSPCRRRRTRSGTSSSRDSLSGWPHGRPLTCSTNASLRIRQVAGRCSHATSVSDDESWGGPRSVRRTLHHPRTGRHLKLLPRRGGAAPVASTTRWSTCWTS